MYTMENALKKYNTIVLFDDYNKGYVYPIKDKHIEAIDISILSGGEMAIIRYKDGSEDRFDDLPDWDGRYMNCYGSYTVSGDAAIRDFIFGGGIDGWVTGKRADSRMHYFAG